MYSTCNPYFIKQNGFILFVPLPVLIIIIIIIIIMIIIIFVLWIINGRSFKQNFSIEFHIPAVNLTVMADVESSEL
jgi:hypothetical protein